MTLVAWRLIYCSNIYIGLHISKPVFFFLFGSHFMSLCLTYVYALIAILVDSYIWYHVLYIFIYVASFWTSQALFVRDRGAFGNT